MTEIIQSILHSDAAVFHFINHTLYWRPAADLTFFLASDPALLSILLLAGIWYYARRGWRLALSAGIGSALAILLSNLVHNEWLKPLFHRSRPFLAMPDIHLCANLQDLGLMSTSFPSTHGASAAAVAVIVAGFDPTLRPVMVVFALAVGWGAIYSGGHYPLDVVAGYGVGGLLGWGILAAYRRLPAAWRENVKE